MKTRDSRPRRRLGAPRLLIVGCGDVGKRILARVAGRFRVLALSSTPERLGELRAAGATPLLGNLDDRASLARIAPFARRVIHLAPPPEQGEVDSRTRHLLAAFGGRPGQIAYISTTGVYGDRGGAPTTETTPLRPASARARRRLDAERVLRAAGLASGLRASVLRTPGIYAHDRLPLARLRAGAPALSEADDVYTNHIHAEDLARLALAAAFHGAPSRVYNAVDESDLKMGEYFDRVADALGLPRPPRLPRAELARVVSPVMLSFMSESRRILAPRAARELKVRLAWPTVDATLASLKQDPAAVSRPKAAGKTR